MFGSLDHLQELPLDLCQVVLVKEGRSPLELPLSGEAYLLDPDYLPFSPGASLLSCPTSVHVPP